MKSSSGEHFLALDHVRALAALLVVVYHFIHGTEGSPVPYGFVPAFPPLALVDEGHTGVAVFMTLSGYLFARLLCGKEIIYWRFVWNRCLRLFPLLFLVIALIVLKKAVLGESVIDYIHHISKGWLWPALPNGGWSITVEFHFYLLLPFLLYLLHRSPWLLAALLGVSLVVRYLVWSHSGEVQFLAYWTLIGRIDQFVAGMLAFHGRRQIAAYPKDVLTVAVAFSLFYWWFDFVGGYYAYPSYPSDRPLWIVLPTIEGFAYAVLICWYDQAGCQRLFPVGEGTGVRAGVSRALGWMGELSYSMYLLHFFVVFRAAGFIHARLWDLSNFYVAGATALFFYLALLPLAYLSYRYLEKPFLRMRLPYTLKPGSAPWGVPPPPNPVDREAWR